MAVYTSLAKKDIDAFLSHYDAGQLLSFKGITEGIENTNYLLITSPSPCRGEGRGGGKSSIPNPGPAPTLTLPPTGGGNTNYILTLYEQRVDPADLPFFLGLTEWLADRGIVCPRPVRGHDGEMVRELKGKKAALIEFLDGRGNPHITPRHLELTGELMARMHQAADGFALSRPNALGLAGWRGLFERFRAQADSIAPGLEQEIGQELDRLEAHWPRELPTGIIHADIFPDNVFFIDGHTDQPELSGIIDFYFACHDFLAYDLMICLNAWCFNAGHQFVPARAQALLRAYDSRRRLTAQERAALPVLARGAAMRFLVTRCYDWLNRVEGALVNPKDPLEYVAKLRFHQQTESLILP